MSDTDIIPDPGLQQVSPQAMDEWRRSTPLPSAPGAGALAPQSPMAPPGMPPEPPKPPPAQSVNYPPMPQAPQQQKEPPPPDAKEYQKYSMEFAGAMAVLGAVAGRFTRAPGGAALGAFASALKGWKEGNLQAYEQASQKWEQETKRTIENNKTVMEKYKIELQNRALNIDEQMSRIQLISAQYHDQMMYDAAASKNYTLVAKIFEKNQEQTQKATDAAAKLQEKRDEQKTKNEQSATYWLSPDGQARLQQLSPAQQAGVKQLIDLYGQKQVGKSVIANDRAQFIQEFKDAHGGTAPTSAQTTAWENSRKGSAAEENAVGRRAGGIALAVQEAHDTIPNVMALAEQNAGKGYATWNAIENKWKVEKGDPGFAEYVQQMNALVNIYGRAVNGGNATVSDKEHARDMLNPNMPLSAVRGAIKGFTREIDIAEQAPGKIRAKMRGEDQGGGAAPADATPPAAEIPAGWGVKEH
jgi:hypothetical protein